MQHGTMVLLRWASFFSTLEIWIGFHFHEIKIKPDNVNWHFCFWLTWVVLFNFTLMFFYPFASLRFHKSSYPLSHSPISWSVLRFYCVFVLDPFKTIWVMLLVNLRTDCHPIPYLLFCLLPIQSGGLVLSCTLHCLSGILYGWGFEVLVLLFPSNSI